MRRNLLKGLSLAALAAALAPAARAQTTAPSGGTGSDLVKVVYHFADGIDQASRGLANIRNHLRGAPETRIVAVALGDGIRFMLKGATERNGKPFDAAVAALRTQGVEFLVCRNTLAAHDVAESLVLPEGRLVPAGVIELARLQAREGFAYIRP